MIKPIDLGSERIQCVEIKHSSNPSIPLTSVYLLEKWSKNHLTEYQEAIDQLYELHQKYNETHKIILGGDINEDLNEPTSTKRNIYLRDFIRDRPFNLQGGVMVFCFVQKKKFRTTGELEYFFFFRAIFFPEFNIRLYDKKKL
jgi:hypothetical protein